MTNVIIEVARFHLLDKEEIFQKAFVIKKLQKNEEEVYLIYAYGESPGGYPGPSMRWESSESL